MKTLIHSIALALIIPTLATAQNSAKLAASVNGASISETEVARAASADLKKLDANKPRSDAVYQRQRLAIMWKALDKLIADKVLGLEAEAASRTKEEMVQIEVDSDLPNPPEQVVQSYYEFNKEKFPGPSAPALQQVRQLLRQRMRSSAYDAYIERLRRQYRVKTFLDPNRKDIPTAGFPSRGPADAPVTIVEFSDFECPYCGNLFPTMKMIEKNYGNKVRFVYRQFPLPWVHPHAVKAAEASLCANQQNRFWDMHDAMFSDQKALTVDDLKKKAAALKLDTASFNACLDSGKELAAVKKDSDAGVNLGVTGTPTVFINGRLVYGTQAYADLKAVIDDELQRKQ